MCGIIGQLGIHTDTPSANRLLSYLDHRGPDNQGSYYNSTDLVWLGHNRLSIIDTTTAGHQPMLSKCSRYILTYNGELYNFKILQLKLKSLGYKFSSSSDTEVVLAACIVLGVKKALLEFEGMYAFALYDNLKKILYLARDPLGIKPLYYAQLNNKFAFASELTPLTKLDWIDRKIDHSAIYNYFRYGSVSSPNTPFSYIKKLEAGKFITFHSGSVNMFNFWNHSKVAIDNYNKNENISLNCYINEFHDLLLDSIRMHMQSDVPYGAFLSGGIDSSLVVALMQKISSSPVNTFTIGFEESSHNEAIYAQEVAKHIGTNHHDLILKSSDILELIPNLKNLIDEPFADNGIIPTYLVSKLARENVTVCLSGDGGDELFGGYPRYFWGNRIEKLQNTLTPVGASYLARVLRSFPRNLTDSLVNSLFGKRYSGSEGFSHRLNRFAGFLDSTRNNTYQKNMSIWSDPSIVLHHSPEYLIGPDHDKYRFLPWAEEMMLIDQINYLQDDILTKMDRASMGVSLEARVPLLTIPIVEYSWRLSRNMKLSKYSDKGKLIMRELLFRYVPKKLIERPKQGFGLPLNNWLRHELRDWVESLLVKQDLEHCGLRSEIVSKIWNKHLDGHDCQKMIWSVLMYRQWHESFA